MYIYLALGIEEQIRAVWGGGPAKYLSVFYSTVEFTAV